MAVAGLFGATLRRDRAARCRRRGGASHPFAVAPGDDPAGADGRRLLPGLSESWRAVAERNYQALGATDSLLDDVGMELILCRGVELETRGHRTRQRDHRRAGAARCPMQPGCRSAAINALGACRPWRPKATIRGLCRATVKPRRLPRGGCSPRSRTSPPASLCLRWFVPGWGCARGGGERQAAIGSLEAV